MIRVFIVDDHPLVLEGLKSLLDGVKGIEMAGYAMNAQSCLGYFVRNTADVVLMDINLPDMSGLDLCKEMRSKYPGIPIVGLSTFSQGSYVLEMMKNGASGYVLKNAGKEELLEAIRKVSQGQTFLSFEAGQSLWKESAQANNQLPELSGREKEVLTLIAEGLTNPEIAAKLYLSPSTIDSHRKNLLAKLNVKNTASLVRFAIEKKLI